MIEKKKTYRLPRGYNKFQTIARSFRSSRRPIQSITENMERFSGTYSAALPGNMQFILTQDPGLINYVLRENHTNYHKSSISSAKGGRLFGNGLLFSNGDYWLHQRRLIQPGFHHKKILGLYEIIIKTINEFLAHFPTGAEVDIYPLMHQLAFNIAVRSLFDIELSQKQSAGLSGIFNELQKFFMDDVNLPIRRILYPITREDRIHYKKSGQLRKLIKDIIHQRRTDANEYHDLLDMLLNARYEDTGQPMSEDQVIDEVLILLFAGHETTASTLSWLLYQVASENEVLEKIHSSIQKNEVHESIRNDYLQAVINESMRLKPAAWITDRVALSDDQYGEISYPKDTIVIAFFYGLHRNKDFWNESSSFIPERFLDEQEKVKKISSFFPFGAGPRLCIGNNFAMAEMSMFLHIFFKQFTISPTAHVPEMKAMLTLHPDKVILGIQKRNQVSF